MHFPLDLDSKNPYSFLYMDKSMFSFPVGELMMDAFIFLCIYLIISDN